MQLDYGSGSIWMVDQTEITGGIFGIAYSITIFENCSKKSLKHGS